MIFVVYSFKTSRYVIGEHSWISITYPVFDIGLLRILRNTDTVRCYHPPESNFHCLNKDWDHKDLEHFRERALKITRFSITWF